MTILTKKLLSRLLLLLVIVLFAAYGCGDMGDEPAGPNVPQDLYWSTDIEPLLQQQGCMGCHGGTAPQAGLNLTDFSAWIDATSNSGNPFVVSGDPDASELLWRLEGSNGLQQMPPGGDVGDSIRDDVRTWIEQGAQQQP